MLYGYIGSMRTKKGHRDDVIEILLSGADGLRTAGCQLYAVCSDPADAEAIWVSEIWDSADHHDASLQLPATKAAIGRAMPLLTGEFTRQELMVMGGIGVTGTGG
ncbi:MAG TPA: antibiotic biosynthesis monooxygenase family protein [Streptosporangiaceae bacterium]|nr:antibiotic biosynthesis monooxygenase family protein [Streptosporangiaceae bacterium]